MSDPFPVTSKELTVERLTKLVQTTEPDARVESFVVLADRLYGDDDSHVSTAARLELELKLVGKAPEKVVVKVARTDLSAEYIYRNEVAFYTRIRPMLTLESPRSLGGEYDDKSGTFGLALEDLRVRNVTFPTVKTPISIDQLRMLMNTLSELHAQFWQSDELLGELSFVAPQTEGGLYELFHDPQRVPALVEYEVANEQFKREMLATHGVTPDQLYRDFRKAQFHQAALPFTLCHGDAHIGNTYLTADGKGGLLDWQLMARGYFMHDLAYLIITSLDVATRRSRERDLIREYLDKLSELGVPNAPDIDTAWEEYRRAATWCLYIGWLTTNKSHYGWDITVNNHIRLFAAYTDLDSLGALASIPEPPEYVSRV